jgi:hypothetical protein
MKKNSAYLNHMLGIAALLLFVPAGVVAQEGYYGSSETVARSAKSSLPVLFAQSDSYFGGGEGYFGAQQSPETCAQSRQVTVRKTGHLMLARETNTAKATPRFADQDAEISSCVLPRSSGVRALPDPSASQNRVEYGGGGM